MRARHGRVLRRAAGAWAGLRVGLGLAALAAPRAAGRFWVGPVAETPGGAVLGRALGARDLALGAGTLHAVRSGAPLRTWVVTAGCADALDALVTAGARPALPPGRRDLVVAASAGSAVLAAVLGVAMGPDRRSDGRGAWTPARRRG
ncbi:hypothetical protein H7X46_02525 [Pseudonocardia sp. C8]|uniref:hypothetical protein n=1 Tax=Pseudonocardia sp. C8 TaxID=2762759 RepID=UPI001642615A|nr:hypothetical protein [Pseudonocardia sp. C8]MBC3189937.1 hypothetical protein [Pseudonocardia sp. C8]